jgi:hypothetical protein
VQGCRLLALYETGAGEDAPPAFCSAGALPAAALDRNAGAAAAELQAVAKGAAGVLFECQVELDTGAEWAAHRARLQCLLHLLPEAAPVAVLVATDRPALPSAFAPRRSPAGLALGLAGLAGPGAGGASGFLEVRVPLGRAAAGAAAQVIPHHETFSTTIQPPYSSTKD